MDYRVLDYSSLELIIIPAFFRSIMSHRIPVPIFSYLFKVGTLKSSSSIGYVQ